MVVNGYTRTCGLIGNPVEHTMSPAIHNTLAQAMGENLVYVPFHVPEGYLREAVEGAYALNLLGCNVTVPYKREVLPYLKEIDPTAAETGAVNTLVRVDGGFKGFNTDVPGLYQAMCRDGVSLEGETALILGAGGVARAVAMLLAQKGAEKVIILNRTLKKAEEVATEVNGITGRAFAKPLALADYKRLSNGPFLAVQATSVGMFPRVEEVVIEDEEFYRKLHTGYDLVFNPARTRFMELTERAGGRAFGGLKMLLWQGLLSYELWTGSTVDEKLAEEAFRAMKSAMGLSV